MNSGFEVKRGADGADNCLRARQSQLSADFVDGVNTGAMRSHEVLDGELLELVGSPADEIVFGGEEMDAPDESVNGSLRKLLGRVGEDIHDAGVTASGDDDEAATGVDDERGVFRKIVFDESIGR